jgi:hypothetical protein
MGDRLFFSKAIYFSRKLSLAYRYPRTIAKTIVRKLQARDETKSTIFVNVGKLLFS